MREAEIVACHRRKRSDSITKQDPKAEAARVQRGGGHVPGVIHDSDRGGGRYTSHALERDLCRHGALPSMGSVADCFDNALAEGLFATLECELLDQQPGGRSRRAGKPSSPSSTT